MDEQSQRWRGRIEADMRNLKDDVKILFAKNERRAEENQKLGLDMAKVKVTNAVFAGLGSLLATALVQLLLLMLKK